MGTLTGLGNSASTDGRFFQQIGISGKHQHRHVLNFLETLRELTSCDAGKAVVHDYQIHFISEEVFLRFLRVFRSKSFVAFLFKDQANGLKGNEVIIDH